ncbi:hypothetical protein DPMN_097268 [Dreissena polymorpha]|uniref:Uncharacterized protein n=1 Tax=Dreissena polymorpha TaxID=45954 RepID=A0A9D4LBH1_DREPO|nr:hypothetical protein DPMN_097268 [Dreissena polymorpha]
MGILSLTRPAVLTYACYTRPSVRTYACSIQGYLVFHTTIGSYIRVLSTGVSCLSHDHLSLHTPALYRGILSLTRPSVLTYASSTQGYLVSHTTICPYIRLLCTTICSCIGLLYTWVSCLSHDHLSLHTPAIHDHLFVHTPALYRGILSLTRSAVLTDSRSIQGYLVSYTVVSP